MKSIGKVLILGDSYSTFLGYVPTGFDYWYSEKIHPDNGVQTVDNTWWKKLMDSVDGELVLNSSWSGTTVCHTGWRGEDYRHKSFVARLDKLIAEGFFDTNKIDTVLVYGATNDSWIGVPLGEKVHGDVSTEELFSFAPAVCYLLDKLREVLPLGRIIYITNKFLRPGIIDAISHATEVTKSEMLLLPDIDLKDGHPTATGMTQIKDAVYEIL
jgi:hypothetical protein